MTMRTGNFANLVKPPLREIFYETYEEVPQEFRTWANVIDLEGNYEDDLIVVGFGAVPAKVEGSPTTYADLAEGPTKRYTADPYGLGFRITRELWDDELHGVMKGGSKALGRSFRNLLDVTAAKMLNNATATGSAYLGADGKALLATNHPRQGAGGTEANKPTTDVDISYTAVQTAIINFYELTDEQDLPIRKRPSLAIVGPNDMFKAAEIFKQEEKPNSADRDKNFVRNAAAPGFGITKYFVSTFLTDTDLWFIFADKSEHSVNMVIKVEPEFDTSDDFDTGDVLVKGYARLGFGFTDWRGVYGSTGG